MAPASLPFHPRQRRRRWGVGWWKAKLLRRLSLSRRHGRYHWSNWAGDGVQPSLFLSFHVSSDPLILSRKLLLLPAVRWSGSGRQRLLTSCSLVQQSGREPDRSSAVERPETCVKQARKTRRGPERGVGAQAQRMCVRRRGSCAESKAPEPER